MLYSDVYKNKNVLIPGCTGFKGSWLALWLLDLGANVVGLSLEPPSNPSHYDNLNLNNFIKDQRFDIRDFKKLNQLLKQEKPDFIFHLAAQSLVNKSFSDSLETFSVNTLGTINLLEALKSLDHECNIIFITSDKCYENVEWLWGYKETDRLGGRDPYSASKAAAEIAISSYSRTFFNSNNQAIQITSTRAGNVIGGGDWALNRIVPDSIRAWSKNKPVLVRNKLSTRPWQHVLEPLSGYLRCGELMVKNKNLHGQSFNFGPNPYNTKSVKDLVEAMEEFWPNSQHVFEKNDNNSSKEAVLLKLNCDKSYEILNWKPTLNFKNTIKMTTQWYFSYYANEITIDISRNNINNYVENAKINNISWTKN